MNVTIRDALAASLSELELGLVAAPSGELGYGRDLSCTTSLDPGLAEVNPLSTRAIGEAVIRRLITPRRGLPDDPDYGLDLRAYLNAGSTTSDLRALAGRVRLELGKDDRIDEAEVSITSPSAGRLDVAVRIMPAVIGLRAFDLVLAVTSSSVLTEAIG